MTRVPTRAAPGGLSRSDALIRVERWRREVHGMPAHRSLADFALPQSEAGFVEAAWYGPVDDRRDPWLGTPMPRAQRLNARRICYLIGAGAIAATREARTRLYAARYGEYHNLCREERFWEQPVVLERDGEAAGGYGYTGCLIGPRHVLTCWHGWETFSHRPHVAIFGYAVGGDAAGNDTDLASVAAEDVVPVKPYPWRQPSARANSDDDCSRDWVVLELERPAARGRAELPRLRPGSPVVGGGVYTLGHPCGLPLKLADGARILESSSAYLRADLDTFVGNSGSPVFDAHTHALVGVISEGQKDQGDFEPSPARGCYVSNRIDQHVTGQLAVPVTCFADALQRSGSA